MFKMTDVIIYYNFVHHKTNYCRGKFRCSNNIHKKNSLFLALVSELKQKSQYHESTKQLQKNVFEYSSSRNTVKRKCCNVADCSSPPSRFNAHQARIHTTKNWTEDKIQLIKDKIHFSFRRNAFKIKKDFKPKTIR